jgi:rod shape-determining protein MreC
MKKIELRYIVLLVFIIIALTLAIIYSAVNENRKLSYPEMVIKDSVLFINRIINTPFNYVKDYVDKEKEKKDILNKYLEIKKQLDYLDLNNAKILELETEIESLKDLLKLNSTLTEIEYLNATVVNRNLGYWHNNIIVDKGMNDGVLVDMAVITNQGLIGKIVQVTNFNSTVKLLTSNDLNSKISVKIKQDEDIIGLLVGYDQKKNAFLISGIDQNADIEIDSKVLTTGMSTLFPSGILVGRVIEVKSDHFDLTKTIYVKPAVDFDNITYVTILRKP